MKEVRVLILNGSPRKNGKVSQLLHIIEQNFLKQNAKVNFYDVCTLNFTPCKGCMACRSKKTCILPSDDAHKICQAIDKCDLLIAGTPVYWGNMNGQLKCLFDRTAGIMMGESKHGIPLPLQKGKKAVIITSCTTPFPFNIFAGQTTKAFNSLKEILSYSGFKIKKGINLSGTKNMKELPPRFIKKALSITPESML
ncbi:flavodoxin family protein [Treponema sp.]|uniref:flavodoxin family protein n=1 Tax=Treponema sp. TaxID=166 RepID=UPI0025F04FB3|nr:flavodoxin family protein [Treponema sp.]MCR5218709.1 flavodoxin family protein [Treponema sp.]